MTLQQRKAHPTCAHQETFLSAFGHTWASWNLCEAQPAAWSLWPLIPQNSKPGKKQNQKQNEHLKAGVSCPKDCYLLSTHGGLDCSSTIFCTCKTAHLWRIKWHAQSYVRAWRTALLCRPFSSSQRALAARNLTFRCSALHTCLVACTLMCFACPEGHASFMPLTCRPLKDS